jgi:glycosyltransferase involved in cell wall biosynthesis
MARSVSHSKLAGQDRVSRPTEEPASRYYSNTAPAVRIRFLTSTPLDITRGSGTYVGVHVLARALESLGHSVAFETPHRSLPIYTLQRLLFNRRLRPSADYDLTVGFDMDGYRIAGGPGYVAALKGVIADEVLYERGFTRRTMAFQARCEKLQVHRAERVLVTSRYSADRARELYGLSRGPVIVPELIDLAEWNRLLQANPARPERFTVLFVGRHYRRKRIDVLLQAAAQLRGRIPDLEVRIVGNGPCTPQLRQLATDLKLAGTVAWLGDIPRASLAAEYNRADVFCLPSRQEGFGIVLLEAMAAGKPIVAARAGAIPEVVPPGSLVEPDNPEALAAAIDLLYRSPGKREALSREGQGHVQQFDAPRVARLFIEAALPGCRVGGLARAASTERRA